MNYKSYLAEQNIDILKNNFVLFYGENLGLKDEFKEKIKIKNHDGEIINFSQEDIVKNDEPFLNEILNVSLFKKKKIIFVNLANDKFLNLFEKIEKRITDQKLYLFSEILDKRSKLRNHFEKSKNTDVVACYADNEISIRKIILEKLKAFKGLSNQNLNIIINNCNLNRAKLKNELSKIVIYFKNKNIESDKLEKLLNNNVNDDFNLLKNAALLGDKIKTNKLLSDTIIEADKNIYYLNLINQRLNKLSEILKLSKNSTIETAISNIKPPIFWKDKLSFIEQAKIWNHDKLKAILKETYKLEIEMKSNSMIEKNVLLKKLIIDMCSLANV